MRQLWRRKDRKARDETNILDSSVSWFARFVAKIFRSLSCSILVKHYTETLLQEIPLPLIRFIISSLKIHAFKSLNNYNHLQFLERKV